MTTTEKTNRGRAKAEAVVAVGGKLKRASTAQIEELIRQWHPQYARTFLMLGRAQLGPELPQPWTSMVLWREEVDDVEVARGGFFGFTLDKRAMWQSRSFVYQTTSEAFGALAFFRALERSSRRVTWTLTVEVHEPIALVDYSKGQPKPRYIDMETGREWIPECWQACRRERKAAA